jgi:putative inorganic carbon (hco3(-)) transporter
MSLRDITIVAIVIALAILALRRPWIGIMNWTWLSIMNPHRYAWGFAYTAPVAAIAAASTLLGLLFTKDRQSPFKGAPTVWLLIFAAWVTVSWLMGYDVPGDHEQWDKVMKIYLMTFVALSLLYTKHHMMAFAWVTIGSLAFLAAKGGLFTVLTGGSHRVWGPAGSFIADNNHFALAVIISIPMLHFLQLQLSKKWQRHLMSVVMLLCVAAALGSHSRGAFLALSAMALVFWWRSNSKGVIGVMILLSLLVILPMMPEHWWERMGSIQEFQEDQSAMGRINAWLVAIEVAKNNVFGAGMSYQHQALYIAYGVHETTARAAHSIYFQVLGNHGFIGLFIYLMIWITTLHSAGRLRRIAKQHPEAKWAGELGAMVQVSLIGFAVGGAFLSMSYFDLPYNLMVLVVLARRWVETRAWETEPNISFLEYSGLSQLIRRRRPSGVASARHIRR